ncbi:hypothetical protein [Methylobacterium dankookense]|uniref:Uncharacterized protein n=1 Tax=Methylobacterium dankookense TaxID=560405 RepID=A0A564FRS4_9HYPH|nr:hypothetical protein [Methylobacterium dankookense]GJD57962.1 hypothetical protein IFDJLNFL_3876 [Methylobacterium dankookense]VUF10420.1 hypothetical protein MTDSW087_00087 [Methylobacterium dankookense]
MIEPNQTALIVKVTRADAEMPTGRVTVFYAIIAEDAGSAVRLVKEAVKDDAEVELTEARLSQDTAQMIGLIPGYARAL